MLKKIIFITLLFVFYTNFSIANSAQLPVLSGVGGNFHATDMHNQAMQLDDYKGKVVILGFGYTNCADICPFTLGYLKQVYEKLPKDVQKEVQIVFVTIDPEYDTIEHLNKFISHFNQDFIGLSGKTKQQTDHIVKLFKAKYREIGEGVPIKAVRNVVQKKNTQNNVRLYDHSVTLYLIDTDGETRNIAYTGTPQQELIANITSLLPNKNSIKIENFKMKNAPKNARSTAAYGQITNTSNRDDILISVSSPIAQRVELHETTIVDGFGSMVHKPNQVISANQTLTLKPMSYHIMFMQLNQPIDELDVVDITLKFKYAGNVPIQIKLAH